MLVFQFTTCLAVSLILPALSSGVVDFLCFSASQNYYTPGLLPGPNRQIHALHPYRAYILKFCSHQEYY